MRLMGWRTCPGAWLLIGVGPAVLSADALHAIVGEKGDVRFTRPMHIGATLLQPGSYFLRHTSENGEHFLIA